MQNYVTEIKRNNFKRVRIGTPGTTARWTMNGAQRNCNRKWFPLLAKVAGAVCAAAIDTWAMGIAGHECKQNEEKSNRMEMPFK